MRRRTILAAAAAALFQPAGVAEPGPVVIVNHVLRQWQHDVGKRLRDDPDYGPLFIGFDPGTDDRTVVADLVDGHFVHYLEL